MPDPSMNYTEPSGAVEAARIHELIAELGSMNDTVRVNARQALVYLGLAAEPALIGALEHANHMVRWGAAKALVEIGDPQTAPAFVKVLEDDVFDIRWIASEGLIALGLVGLEPLLRALIEHPEIPSLREGGKHVVHSLSQMGMSSLLEPLTEAFDSIHPATTIPPAASHALDAIRDNRP